MTWSTQGYSEQRLPELQVLRRIDRAMLLPPFHDIDNEISSILRDVLDFVQIETKIVDPSGATDLWACTDEVNDWVDFDRQAVELGLEGQALELQWRQRRSTLTSLIRATKVQFGAPQRAIAQKDFIHTLSTQLESLFAQRGAAYSRFWLDEIESRFFRADLQPVRCLESLTEMMASVIPRSRLYSQVKPDLTQLLIRDHHDQDLLRIVASTGDVAGGPLVRISDSVVGLVFAGPDGDALPFVNEDPSGKHAVLYKPYSRKQIRSELVLPLADRDGIRFAALNLESAAIEAFSARDVAYLRSLATRLSLLVEALRKQIEADHHARFGMASAQSHYWVTLGRILRHDLRQPLTGISLVLREIRERSAEVARHERDIADFTQGVDDLVTRARKSIVWQLNQLGSFADAFNEYLRFSPTNTSDIVDRALRIMRQRLADSVPRHVPDIRYFPPGERDLYVRASPLLDVFLFNVLENASYWIDQVDRADYVGVIELRVNRAAPMGPAIDLNRIVSITVRDNGPGVDSDTLRILNDSTHHNWSGRPDGDGYALQGLKEFVAYMGGSVRFDSMVGEFFEVAIDLPEVESRKDYDDGVGQTRVDS
jgi:signal transduction histidine kinase